VSHRVSTHPWDVRGSGLRSVGPSYNRLRGKSLRIQKEHGADRRKPRPETNDHWLFKEEIPEYQEGRKYTKRELTLMADWLLFTDEKEEAEDPMILNPDMYKRRVTKEIYNKNGIPDPEIVSGLFNRTHPQGRKVNSDEQRAKNGASFYK
jgi:hypothetical protein